MARRLPSSPSPASAPPLEDDDLLHEILLRLPPQPQHLLRASVVSKRWRRLATDPQFRRRFRIHHGKPLLLGLFSGFDGKFPFRSTLDPPCCIPPGRFPLPVENHEAWRLLDCRHGCVLFHDWKSRHIVVWDPITNNYRNLVYTPQFLRSRYVMINNGAVLCAAGGDQGHLHGDCHSSPFKVVLLATLRPRHQVFTAASVYFSETGMWSDFLSTALSLLNVSLIKSPGTLVGNVIHWMSIDGNRGGIQFDLDNHRLAFIESPPDVHGSVRIIHSENGGVGLVSLSNLSGDPHFQMWEMKVNSYGVATWELRKTVKLQNVLGLGFRIRNDESSIVGYAEDIRAIILQVHTSVCMVQLDSLQSKELFKRDKLRTYHPFTSFYTEVSTHRGTYPLASYRRMLSGFSGQLGAKQQAKHVL